jgi:hypothetical protein
MDLAKIGEVWERKAAYADKDSALSDVNARLAEGWVIIFVKVVSDFITVYILGKPREKPKHDDSLGPHGCNHRE